MHDIREMKYEHFRMLLDECNIQHCMPTLIKLSDLFSQ